MCRIRQRTRLDIGQETRDPEEGRVKLAEWDVTREGVGREGRRWPASYRADLEGIQFLDLLLSDYANLRFLRATKELNGHQTRWAVKQKRSALDLCHSASPSGAKNATDAPSRRPEGASFAYDTASPPRKLRRGLLRAQEPSSPAPQRMPRRGLLQALEPSSPEL